MPKGKSNFEGKVVVVGNPGVGKTCVTSKLCGLQIANMQSSSTVGTDILNLDIINSENQKIRINFWDTAGQQRYRTIAKTYFKGATVALFVFSATTKNPMLEVREWIKQSSILNQKRQIAIAIVGNKLDLNPNFEYTSEDLQQIQQIQSELAAKDINNLHKFLVSAKTGENLQLLKQWIITEISAILKQKNPLGNRHIFLSEATNSFILENEQNNREVTSNRKNCC